MAVVLGAPPATASDAVPVRLPAAGELVTSSAAVRAAPDQHARVLRVLHRLGRDQQFTVVLAIRAVHRADRAWWYELSLPGRPNGQRGWVRSELLDLRPVANRIVVNVGARRIFVHRIADGRLLLSGVVVAIGKPGAETPLGRDFYVQRRFVPRDPFFGASCSRRVPTRS